MGKKKSEALQLLKAEGAQPISTQDTADFQLAAFFIFSSLHAPTMFVNLVYLLSLLLSVMLPLRLPLFFVPALLVSYSPIFCFVPGRADGLARGLARVRRKEVFSLSANPLSNYACLTFV